MKTAPLSCPKCGEEKRWLCSDQPETPWPKEPKLTAFDLYGRYRRAHFSAIALKEIGLLIYTAILHAKPIHYHCEKCGFTGKYKQD